MLKIWRGKNFLAYLLWPLSLVYIIIIYLRRKLYQTHLLKINSLSVPVIVVGNITIGGTGKTPVVIRLARFLKEQGWRPGIISRGYGSNTQNFPCFVHPNCNAREVGDEPLLIAQQTGCPTVIDPNRSRGAKHLLKRSNCNIVISDDGLQHLSLGRNLEIVVVDGKERFGNNFCLPAGPLREPVSRLNSVDFVVSKGTTQTNEFKLTLIPDFFYPLIQPENKQSINHFHGKKVHAVAGIGNPHQFFNLLRQLGLQIIEHSFPDHYLFKPRDLNYGEDAIIIMTEKDAVKCVGFVDTRLWCLRTKTELDNTLLKAILHRITLLDKNLKSSSS
ncbi:tetraacyldisaccharide 4'-kinase [Rickettsiella grylli]|uniref:Tetraacyldisaccharide 4'-kinase n=1 Tax=Rickettsiella grylli TaxID=59196 RepID=A8PP88_9COXI|nr:tetraacyldisaccharide 4'-kinase [Rickettsiella grylli]EDP45934.1 tetraacyldisaccharide 4'-kinase [Rickettsiella grylli]